VLFVILEAFVRSPYVTDVGQPVEQPVPFMELRTSRGMPRVVALAGLLWLGILLVGTLDDRVTRNWLPVRGK
jgi:hypothetical protein